jgi:branched-chain amino acid transport system ATP-binding protein
MLRIANLEAGYGTLRVLKKVSLHVGEGDAVAIIGANGAGKTTLLKSIAGVMRPGSGTIVFDKQSIAGLSPEKIVRRGCCLVPENRHVFASLTVKENLTLGAYIRFGKDGRAAIEKDMLRIYDLFPILAERQQQLAGTMSGGQQQMLAIGRALMSKPRLLMLDEPSLGVAPLVVRDIFKALTALKREGLTILVVEQNARAALAFADRGYCIETGQIILSGTSEELSSSRDVQRAYLGKDYQRIEE